MSRAWGVTRDRRATVTRHGTRSTKSSWLAVAVILAAAVCLAGSPREAGAVPTLRLFWAEFNGVAIFPDTSIQSITVVAGDDLLLGIQIIPASAAVADGISSWFLNLSYDTTELSATVVVESDLSILNLLLGTEFEHLTRRPQP